MRNINVNILKGLAIIFVVMAHSGCPASIGAFCYMVCCSLFFLASGYCFKPDYLHDEARYVKRRVRHIYVPFVLWSVLFLVLNPLLFATGFLNEQYGNAAGGVTHPLGLHEWLQALWSIVFNMSGYDQFLCGAYWFFRSLFVASIAYLVCMIVVERVRYVRQRHQLASFVVALLALALAFWQTSDGLKITGLAQGGFRELMGLFFIAAGFCFSWMERRLSAFHPARNTDREDIATEATPAATAMSAATATPAASAMSAATATSGATTAPAATATPAAIPLFVHIISFVLGVLVLYAILQFSTPAMHVSEKEPINVFFLALSGIVAFPTIYSLSALLSRVLPLRRILSYIGDNTLYIFGFHLLAFKVVSMIKVGVYHLPWLMVGGHPVVHSVEGGWFWTLYTIVGVGLPLGVVWTVRYCAEHYNIHSYVHMARIVLSFLWKCLRVFVHWLTVASIWIATNGWQAIKSGVLTAWEGIYNFCIRFVDTVKAGADVEQDREGIEEIDDDDDEDEDDDEYEEDDDDEYEEDDEEDESDPHNSLK